MTGSYRSLQNRRKPAPAPAEYDPMHRFGYGFSLGPGPWQLVLARVHRTREFKGQKNRPVFGSVSIKREF